MYVWYFYCSKVRVDRYPSTDIPLYAANVVRNHQQNIQVGMSKQISGSSEIDC